MFGLDSLNLAEPKVNMDTIREWSEEISSSYFNSGADPTYTLTKIAKSESLTPDQIQTLAAEVNKSIHQTKYAQVEDKYHAADFPLADARQAIKDLQVDGGQVKVAKVMPLPKIPDIGPDAFEMFGIEPPPPMDKTASIKGQGKNLMEKLALLGSKINDILIKTAAEKVAAERRFLKMARQSLLEEPNSLSRMKVIGQYDHFIKEASKTDKRLEKIGNTLMAKLCYVVGHEGKLEPTHMKEAVDYFMKVSDQKAPAVLISDNLQAQVINGEHPLYITLKTIGDREADQLRYEQQEGLVKDKVRILGQKVRAL